MSLEPSAPSGTRERELFLRVLEQPSHARAAFVANECGNDAAMQRRIMELLREQDDLGTFLETPAVSGKEGSRPALFGPHGTAVAGITEKAGDRIGRYKLLQKIGEGGCGIVYMADQEEPVRRRVALKVIKLGMDTRSVIARFEAERQALAMMDHPNIARVLDAGATEAGRPYFVMELVRGVRITDYCDENNLSTDQRLRLLMQVCQAIQHAHQKGIIHRDIKPSNILVTLHDSVPVPKVIDFGIAKATEQRLTDKTLFTEFTAFIGTPAYMSPEQAEMSGLDIDTRSDIYSLGVLLYELLTGRTPFDAEDLIKAGLDECRRTIREKEPVRPSTRIATLAQADLTTTAHQRHTEGGRLVHLLRGDLDWVAMRCLEKDRTRRYATANDLALDIGRYLESEPVQARPPSNLYRLQKLIRRNRGAFAAAAAILIALLGGAGISTWQAIRATRAEHRALAAQKQDASLRRQAEEQRGRAEQGENSARLNEYVADINLAQQSLAAGNLGRAVQLLDKHWPRPGQADLRGFEWRYLWQLCQGDEHLALPEQEGSVQSVALSPNGSLLAVGMRERFTVWKLPERRLIAELRKGALSMAFLPDGNSLVTASPSTVRVWSVADWSEQYAIPECSGPIALSPDGSLLATISGGPFPNTVRVWNTTTWNEDYTFQEAFGPVAFTPDGKRLATDTSAGLTLWPLDREKTKLLLEDSTNMFPRVSRWFRADRAMAFSPDGKFIAGARNTLSDRGVFVLSVWDTTSGKETVIPDDPAHVEHTGAISSVAFSPDGRLLATASMDHSIRLWDFSTRQRITTLQGHLNEVWTVAFSSDGQTLVSGAKDGGVKLWKTRRPVNEDMLAGAWQPMGFSTDSRTLAALDRNGDLIFLNLATRETEQQFESNVGRNRMRFWPALSLSADLQTLALAHEDGGVQIQNTRTRESWGMLRAADNNASRRFDLIVLSPDGRFLVTGEGGRNRELRWWDLNARTNCLLHGQAFRAAFSPDGRTLALFDRNSIEFLDLPSRASRTNLLMDPPPAFPPSAAFSRDGRLFAISCQDDSIRLWNTRTGQLLGTFIGHKQGVSSVAISPDGRTLATASEDSTLKFWNIQTQQELLGVRRLGGAIRELTFSPDGRTLVGSKGFSSRTGGLLFHRAPDFSEIGAMRSRPAE